MPVRRPAKRGSFLSEELFYTSAPRGLKADSRDYCTVTRTQALDPSLADDMESLSGYRILYMPRARTPLATRWSGRT